MLSDVGEVLKSAEVAVTILAAIATFVGAFGAFFLNRALMQPAQQESWPDLPTSADPAKNDVRLPQLEAELARQERLGKRSGYVAGLLTFGQYVIGGLLVSSYLQQYLAPNIAGFLGFLVLVSSVIHTRYRPDLAADGARQRAYLASKAIRSIEDELFARRNNHPNAAAVEVIRKKASTALDEIAQSELWSRGTKSVAKNKK